MRNQEFHTEYLSQFDTGMANTIELPADEEWTDLQELRADFEKFLSKLEREGELPCELTLAVGVDRKDE